eukprot:TRINITY_DN1723_c0_g1_i13.p2 TRINITY_DN1723_c0_g1~~TRINITY_DN1723_c0_g1_i13.p2  ORF type:complete len:587 (-),score=50.60 TRINITY_DN1723_c0_g1_i13:676-2187(-)
MMSKRHLSQRIHCAMQSTSNTAVKPAKEVSFDAPVVVVGGGPAGVAAALMLAQRGWKNILVLEALTRQKYFDLDRSYPYGVFGRGQKLLHLLNVHDKLLEFGTSMLRTKNISILPNGKQVPFPAILNPPHVTPGYYIPRLDLFKILETKLDDYQDTIKFQFQAKVLELAKTGKGIEVTYEDENGAFHKKYAQLVVGADGIRSFVRQTLQTWTDNQKFQVVTSEVPMTGLKYKMLNVQNKFPLNNEKNEFADLDQGYILIGKNNKLRNQKLILQSFPVSLSLQQDGTCQFMFFPQKQDNLIFQLKTGEQLLEYLEESLPQVPIRDMVTEQEAERFAQSKGGRHPLAGYCENLTYINDNFGVILLGDAAHYFPARIGQGVNAAFEDVTTFNDLLQQYNDDLFVALEQYEKQRLQDSKSLIELCNSGNLTLKFPFLEQLGLVVLVTKTKLYQFSPQLFPAPTYFYYNDENLSYTQALKYRVRANRIYGAMIFSVLALFVMVTSIVF